MEKYLSLCNWHLSNYGRNIALFEGSNFGKSSGGYSSDLRHAKLYKKEYFEQKHHENHVGVKIADLGMTEEDFERFRGQAFDQHILKDTVMKMTKLPYSVVCKFEKEGDDQLEREKHFGYCSENGSICEGSECESSIGEDWETCPCHVNYCKCNE